MAAMTTEPTSSNTILLVILAMSRDVTETQSRKEFSAKLLIVVNMLVLYVMFRIENHIQK